MKILSNHSIQYGRLFVALVSFLSITSTSAQEAPLLEWAGHFKGAGGVSDNFGYGIVTDAAGNVYATGSYSGTTDFDPGSGVYNLTSAFGSEDIYISKLDNNGNFVWAVTIGQGVFDAGYAIAVDAGGNVYITGTYRGNVDFDPGPGTFTLAGSALNYSFILKLDTDGNFLWAIPIGAGSTFGSGRGIELDNSNNVLVTGIYSGTVDFDPGVGFFNMTSAGGDDIYIIKLDANGNFVWAKSMGGAGFDRGFSISIDNSNNVLTTGSYSGVVDFDPGAGLFSLPAVGITDIFISKLDAAGNFVWAKSMGGLDGETGNSLTTDGLNNVFITGRFKATVDFDPGAAVFNLSTGTSNEDGFIAKLDASGNFGWAVSIGGSTLQRDSGNGVTIDVSGNVLVTGFFEGTVDFDFGAGTFNLTSAIFGTDIYLLKLDTDGNFIWAVQTGGNNDRQDEGNAITMDAFGSIWSTGSYSTSADFDFGPCGFPLAAEFNTDINTYVEKVSVGNFGPPNITSFSPASGTVGITVIITGTNFSPVPAENDVRWSPNQAAVVTASTPTSITATVPPGAATGKISVTVSCYPIAISVDNFIVGASVLPTITSFTPTSGPIGTTVTITGTNFSATPVNNIVYFGATRANVSAATTTQLTLTVPTGATHQPISVQTNGLTANSLKPYVVTFAGGGSFDNCSFETKVNFETNDGLSSEAFFGDIDGDGKVDVITAKRNTNSISIYRNTSIPGQINSGSFAPKVDFITGTSGSSNPGPVAISFGDIDGDGKPDIAVANYRGGSLAVFRNLSTSGIISLSSRVEYAIGDFATGLSLRDMDGDGKLDAVITSFFDGVSVLRNTATSGIINASSFASRLNFATGPNPFHPSIADFDRDGKLDIAVPNANNYTFSLLHNTSTSGTVSFAPQQVVTYAAGTPALGTGTYPLSAGDLDGDGKIDLVVCNNTLSIAPIFTNTSTGTITFAPQVDLATSAPPAFASISDLDGDGKVDLALFNGLNNPILVYKNSNVPGTISTALFGPPIGFGADPLVGLFGIADIDGDGKNDIVNESNGFYVLRNVIGEISPPTITSFTPAFGDIGTVVTVTGSGFGTPFANTVTFNGIPAIISGSTATTLTVTVPAGTTTGIIQATIGCNAVSSGTNFEVCSVPTPPLATGSSICGSGGVTLNSSGGINGNYVWYNVPTGGISFAGAVNDSFITPSISVTTNFYVALRSGSCESSRTLVTATIIPLPASPTVTAGTGCGPAAIITLGASGGSAGQYRWYATPTGGSPFPGEINPTYDTPSLSTTTTYYVSIDNGTCESLRIAVVAEIKSCTPTVSTASLTTPIGSITTIDIAPLVTTVNDPIDIASIKVTQQPISGALATISAGVLSVDYTGISFAGTDVLTIEACDLASRCAQADITIEVVGDITVYNALSPNGDGKNDNFIIEYIESLPDTQKNKVTIFNRWGTAVFEIADYNNSSNVFKGLSNSGGELPSGTYYYTIEFTSGATKRTGFISLRR